MASEYARLAGASQSGYELQVKWAREIAEGLVKSRNINWPVGYDGKGWESPLVRELGINGLPTVWLLDSGGRLRSLNALEGAAGKARQLATDR